MNFQHRLSALIDSNNITAYQLSKETGISESLIGKWRRGIQVPGAENLLILSHYFNVSIDYLLKGEDSSPPPTPEPDELEQKVISFCEELGIGPGVSRKMIVESVRVAVQQKSK